MRQRVVRYFEWTLIVIMALFIFTTPAFASTTYVHDLANLFPESEKEDLQSQAETLTKQLEMDLVIVTTTDNGGKGVETYAQDFYEEHEYGYEDSYDGVLLLIDMGEREVYLLTSGVATKYVTDERRDSLLDQIYPHLSEGAYSTTAESFLTGMEGYVEEGIPDNQHTVVIDEKNVETEMSLANKLLGYLGISCLIGIAVVSILATKNRSTSSISKGTYLLKDSFRLIRNEDRHYNTKVTKRRIQTQSSSGTRSSPGRSTVRRSSSGRTYGGGGRKF